MPTRVPAAERTLDVLTALAHATGPMTAAGLARAVGAPRSSTYQLLAVLADRGFVTHLPDEERWALGLAAFEVGSAFLRHDPIERLAQPLLRQLVEQADLPVVAHLGVVRGAETVYLLKEQSPKRVTLVTEVGVRLPAPLTASGRAILMTLTRAQVRAQCAVPGAFVDRTGRGPQTLSALRDLLGVERRRGYAEEDGFITEGYASVAVPVLDHDGVATAAIGLTFRSAEVPDDRRPRLARAARRCADDLQGRLHPG
jgi:DNA-binding IclR family transcriptional regulator